MPESAANNLRNLEELYLGANSFEGSFPTNIFKLSKLRVLDLYVNNFSGSIPNGIEMLPDLGINRIYNNSFEGIIPSSISLLKDLQHLDFSDNLLASSIISYGSNLTDHYWQPHWRFS